MTRYLSGLCVAGLGLCGGCWLVVAAVAFGGESAGRAGRVNLLTGAVLIAVAVQSLAQSPMCQAGVVAQLDCCAGSENGRRGRAAMVESIVDKTEPVDRGAALLDRTLHVRDRLGSVLGRLLPDPRRVADELDPVDGGEQCCLNAVAGGTVPDTGGGAEREVERQL